jgi:hypothetical protein
LDANAGDEGTIFEVGTGPTEESELVTRLSVLPRENAFALASISNVEDGRAGTVNKRVEYANAEGPPVGVAYLRSTTLPLSGAPLPRDAWFHVALVHSAATDQLRLFIEGRQRAVVVIEVTALPHGNEAYVSVACDGRGQRVLAGALDELRITDEAEYAADFTPPESFSRGLRAAPSPSLPSR